MQTSKLKLINTKDAFPALMDGIVGKKGVTLLPSGKATCWLGLEGVNTAITKLKTASGVDSIPSFPTKSGGEAFYLKLVGADDDINKEMENLLAGDRIMVVGFFKKSGKDGSLWFNILHLQLLQSVDTDLE